MLRTERRYYKEKVVCSELRDVTSALRNAPYCSRDVLMLVFGVDVVEGWIFTKDQLHFLLCNRNKSRKEGMIDDERGRQPFCRKANEFIR